MAENIGTGVVIIEADTKGLGRDIEKKVDGEGSHIDRAGAGMGTRLATAFKLAAGTAAAAAAIAFVKGTINAASDLAESANAVNVTFGEAAGGIAQLGENAATAVGLSATEFNGLAVRFSAFATTVAGAGGDVVGTMDDMTTRAADFASVMNLDVAEAAELFQSGLAGESEPLRKFGIDLSAASVEAFAVANGIVASGEAMTEAQKVQARYGLLMESTNQTAGDFANTSDGLANQQRIMAAQFENVKAKIGQGLIPVMSAVVNIITKYVIPAFLEIRDALAVAFSWIEEHKEILLAAFTGLALGIAIGLVPAFIAWATVAGAAAIATIAAAAPVIALGVALAALAAGIVWAYQNWGWFKTAVDAVASFITDTLVPAFQSMWSWIVENIIPAIMAVVGWINDNLVPAFQAIARFIMDTLVPAFATVVNFIFDEVIPVIGQIISKFIEVATAVGTKVGEIVAFIVGIPGRISDTISTLWDGLKTGVTAAKDWVGSAIDGIVSFAKGLPGRINGFFSGMWDGIASSFKSAINSVIRGWNGLEFTLPSFDTHIPGVGTVGGFTIGTPNIGYLAAGGVISQPTIAMIGEAAGARRNPEIVSPVRLMADTFRDVLKDGGGGGMTVNNYRRDLTVADLGFLMRMNELMSPGSVVAA